MSSDREQRGGRVPYTRYRAKRRLLGGGGGEDELDRPGASTRSAAPAGAPPAAPGGPRRPVPPDAHELRERGARGRRPRRLPGLAGWRRLATRQRIVPGLVGLIFRSGGPALALFLTTPHFH